MVTVNSLSGGETSSFMAVKFPANFNVFSVVCFDDPKCAVKDKIVLNYAKEKLQKFIPEFGEFVGTAEDDKTLAAVMDLEQIIGREIIWVRGKSFDNVINERHQRVLLGNRFRLPSWARRYCTEEMKLLPIFLWWMENIGEKCAMRIGFRFDEFKRMERFSNNSDPCNFKIPVSSSLRGEKRQQHQIFNWRYCAFPLVEAGISKQDIGQYWSKNGFIKASLFEPERKIEFPVISNCVGCFHKKEETIAAMAQIHPNKIQWFSEQENKGMGTWLDSRKLYSQIIQESKSLAKEVLTEIKHGDSCDSGGCTA